MYTNDSTIYNLTEINLFLILLLVRWDIFCVKRPYCVYLNGVACEISTIWYIPISLQYFNKRQLSFVIFVSEAKQNVEKTKASNAANVLYTL